MTGITRSAAAKIIAEHFGTSAVHVGGTYDTYTVEDDTGRKWKVVSDASIQCQSRGERTASRLYAVEVVSPICKYEDIETIQELVRELRRGGAKVNDSCGIHIHVDASRHDPKTLRNIVNIMASKEDLLYKALRVQIDREYYCQKADLRFLEDVNLKRPKSMSEFETLWYNGSSRRGIHYDSTRYHALNLHSVFSKGTIEFRIRADRKKGLEYLARSAAHGNMYAENLLRVIRQQHIRGAASLIAQLGRIFQEKEQDPRQRPEMDRKQRQEIGEKKQAFPITSVKNMGNSSANI